MRKIIGFIIIFFIINSNALAKVRKFECDYVKNTDAGFVGYKKDKKKEFKYIIIEVDTNKINIKISSKLDGQKEKKFKPIVIKQSGTFLTYQFPGDNNTYNFSYGSNEFLVLRASPASQSQAKCIAKKGSEIKTKKVKYKNLKTNEKKYVFKNFSDNLRHFKIKKKDPTLFRKLEYLKTTENNSLSGQMGCSFQKHACSPETKQYDAHIFLATYSSGKQIEFVIDDRYKKKRAEKLALRYATMVGQVPSFLINGYCLKNYKKDLSPDGFSDPSCTKGVNKIRIDKGVRYMFARPKENWFIIYPDNFNKISENVRWIVLVHEMAHVSLDSLFLDLNPGATAYETLKIKNEDIRSKWNALAIKDEYTHITNYAGTNTGEDLAETSVAWVALRCMEKTSKKHRKKILEGVPNRIKLLDSLKLNTEPMKCEF